MKKYFVIIFLLISSAQGFSQYKYEREVRVRESNVPAAALEHVASMQMNTNIRWYREEGNQKIYFEAKTKFEGQRYSIKFNEDGSFVDLEIEVASDMMPVETRKAIEKHLATAFGHYTIEKIQIQYTGDPVIVLQHFREWPAATGIEVHYEVVISTRRNGVFVMFEMLYTDEGELVHQAEIRLKSIDNLLY